MSEETGNESKPITSEPVANKTEQNESTIEKPAPDNTSDAQNVSPAPIHSAKKNGLLPGCALLIVIALAIIYLLSGSGATPYGNDARALFPASTALYIESRDLPQLFDAASRHPALKPDEAESTARETRVSLAKSVSVQFKINEEAALQLVNNAHAFHIGLYRNTVEPKDELFAAIIFDDAKQAETVIRNNVLDLTLPNPENGIGSATGRYGQRFFYKFTDGMMLLATEAHALQKKSPEKSDDTGLPAGRLHKGTLLCGFAEPARNPERMLLSFTRFGRFAQTVLPEPSTPQVVRSNRLRDGAIITFELTDRGQGAELTVAAAAPEGEPSAPGGHGILYYLVWLILTPIAICVAGILLLVGLTLLLSGYFWLRQWMGGELSPAQPPRLPELSPQLKEDLGVKPEDEPTPPTEEKKDYSNEWDLD